FVNHGAFGAPCAPALAAAAAWRAHAEAQPLRFIDRELFPHLAEATRRAASWLGAPPVEVALVQNATTGLNAVVPSVVHGLGAGDEVIILDVGYGSVATMLRRACAVSGARPVVVELLPALARLGSGGAPPTAAAVGEAALELVDRAMTPRTRLAIFDDITSNTALKLPCRALAELCRERGVLSLVDAAHGAASPRGVEALATADFVVGNLHKWACAPRGSAFLFAREAHHAALEPPVVSHGHGHGFHAAFAWSGAGDAAPLLSLSTLFDCFWRDAVGGPAAGSAYQQQLLAAACAHLCAAWGTNTLVDAADSGVHMALVELPPAPDGVTSKDVQDALHFQHRVECPVKTVHGRLYCRVSAA
ncbi:pyridoxal phosphate-dependent transferase, partial [Pelagophyceae sp. CCMP2097]